MDAGVVAFLEMGYPSFQMYHLLERIDVNVHEVDNEDILKSIL